MSEVVDSVVDIAEELAPLSEVTGGRVVAFEVDKSVSESMLESHPVAVSVVETPPVERGIPVERDGPVERGILVERRMERSILSCGRGLASVPPSKRKNNKRESIAEENDESSTI